MRVMVTGARGMLGSEMVKRLAHPPGAHEVIAVDIGDFDIADFAAARAALEAARPDLVCHCAAYTDVDGCERDPQQAWRVNALGAWSIAAALRASQPDAVMIYISTDYVFDGEKREPYTEYDEPRPLNVYGWTKLAGERHVRELVPRHFIVRAAWMFAPHGRNFVLTMLRRARELVERGAEPVPRPSAGMAVEDLATLPVVSDQVGSPTSAADLADAIARHLVESQLYGTYHMTNAGSCSWAELAGETLRLAGIPVRVKPISSSEWPSSTRRPAYSVLRRLSLELQGRDDLRPWQEALAEVVERMQP